MLATCSFSPSPVPFPLMFELLFLTLGSFKHPRESRLHLNEKGDLAYILKSLKCLSDVPVLSFLFPYRWHIQLVPTQIQSRSLQVWLKGWSSLKCCGSWAQCWLCCSSSASSSPSSSLRSKKPCFWLLVGWGWNAVTLVIVGFLWLHQEW